MGMFTKKCVIEPTEPRLPFRFINVLGVRQMASGFDKMYCGTAGTSREGIKT